MSVIDELQLPALPEPLPRPVIDNHTHLDTTFEYSSLPVDESLRLARQVGVTRVVQVGCDVEGARFAVDLAEREPSVRAAVALHPNDAARAYLSGGSEALDGELGAIAALVGHAAVVAVGETGLDYYRTTQAEGRRAQEVSFRRHIAWARDADKALMIHDRDAHDDILRILDDEGVPARWVMHCFSGDADFAQRCLDRGAFLSLPGTLTFASAGNIREAALVTPLDRMLVETDAPFLTPKPCRGKPNAPYLLPHTVRFLADLLGVDLGTLCDQLVTNTFAAYGQWGEDA